MLAYRGTLSASEISNEFNVTPQAISQHLRILREAKVIRMEKRAQQRLYSFNPRTMDQVQTWVADLTKLWGGRLDRLEKALTEKET